MKKVTLTIEEYLYQFYEKIGQASGKGTEQVMKDMLFRAAGELSAKVTKYRPQIDCTKK